MFTLEPIAFVQNSRKDCDDDNWGNVIAEIKLVAPYTEKTLMGIDTFSHAEIIFLFHQVAPDEIITHARHPRNNPNWPKVGILAQRARKRPNRIGTTMVRILRRRGKSLFVEGLDAIDGTPVLDIKPVMREFLPREPIIQPEWVSELMHNYWKKAD